MKFLFSFMISLLYLLAPASWLTNFAKAKTEAVQEHKYILLNFSGSDWCGPCIRLHKTIFEADEFQKFADQNLVLVNADFPRLKKNQLSKEQTTQNETLAEQYNPHGTFPLTVLLNADGKVVKQWEGYPDETPQQFVEDINAFLHAHS